MDYYDKLSRFVDVCVFILNASDLNYFVIRSMHLFEQIRSNFCILYFADDRCSGSNMASQLMFQSSSWLMKISSMCASKRLQLNDNKTPVFGIGSANLGEMATELRSASLSLCHDSGIHRSHPQRRTVYARAPCVDVGDALQ